MFCLPGAPFFDRKGMILARPVSTRTITVTLGDQSSTTFLDLTPGAVTRAGVARKVPEYVGQKNVPVRYWCVTTQSHIFCESKLERERLVLADFDPDVESMTSQPFWLQGVFRGKPIKHVPDFMFVRRDSVVVCNVKPAAFVHHPRVRRVFEWMDRLMERKAGWSHEVWTGEGESFTYLQNVRALAGSKNTHWFDPTTLSAIQDVADGSTIAEVMTALSPGIDPLRTKRAIQHLLWRQVLQTNLHKQLSKDSLLAVKGAS